MRLFNNPILILYKEEITDFVQPFTHLLRALWLAQYTSYQPVCQKQVSGHGLLFSPLARAALTVLVIKYNVTSKPGTLLSNDLTYHTIRSISNNDKAVSLYKITNKVTIWQISKRLYECGFGVKWWNVQPEILHLNVHKSEKMNMNANTWEVR